MKYELNGIYYDVIINKKNNKNLYVRVKDDKKIYVSCNYLTTQNMIKKVLDDNISFLNKAINKVSKVTDKNKLLYLGKAYNVIIDEKIDNVMIVGDNIIAKSRTFSNTNFLQRYYCRRKIKRYGMFERYSGFFI